MSHEQKPSLFDVIMNLRMSAAALHDEARLKGMKPEQIAKDLAPIHDALTRLISWNAQHSLGECFFAVMALEKAAENFEASVDRLLEKAKQDRHYCQLIRSAIRSHMKDKGLRVLQDGTFFATLVEHEGRESLELR